ncbi:ABC transporter permease [Paracoccus spongiarum]|uniref:ABC transporter n=1 Tax=Paracoccus spongiarum TaxID=3064387 RepID=A0ABT9JA27_9RHOB|nr:ABC transporter [Paracoccus sp. 2205BS29-5]MDP5306575.1 ABC transporter [Paracoccus sp. 2205BS29-5]
MFTQRRTTTIFGAAGTTLALIHHQTVYNLRTEHRNAVVGLLLTILQTAIFMGAFLLIYLVIGVRQSPIRADFMMFIMSGIFLFMTHVQTVGAVSSSHSVSGQLVKHDPLNPAVLIAASALAVLYRQTISCIAILWLYHVLIAPVEMTRPVGALAMYLLAWLSGVCVGLVFLGIRPWAPRGSKILTTIYQRVNMFASGKMFVANILPNFMLPWFTWNPLFHVIDQERGYMFINYSPQKTDPAYALWFSCAALMVGLLINFSTRKYESISWSATQ